MQTINESERISMDLWNSHPLKVGSVRHGDISSSNPLNWCIKILKAVLYNRHAAKTHFQPITRDVDHTLGRREGGRERD
jgi:hypothetical protein